MIVSLILPCYNPASGWEQIVCSNCKAFEENILDPVEFIIVMDGPSATITPDSLSYLRQNISGLKVVQYAENRGKGYAIRQGVAVAAGDIIMYTDIDFPYTQDSMQAIYKSLANHELDVAVGVKDDAYYGHVPPLRRVISRFLRMLIRLFLSMPITDTQCGLKGLNRRVAPLFLKTTIDRYLFDLEFIRNCFKAKTYRVKAIPITLNENIHFRSMNYRILFSESVNFIRLLFGKVG